jgi:hypothetical protein
VYITIYFYIITRAVEYETIRPAQHLFSILYYFCASRERYYSIMFDDLAVFICRRHRIKEEKSKKNNKSFRFDSWTTRAHTMRRCIYVLHTHVIRSYCCIRIPRTWVLQDHPKSPSTRTRQSGIENLFSLRVPRCWGRSQPSALQNWMSYSVV